jgi:hypothetical protein
VFFRGAAPFPLGVEATVDVVFLAFSSRLGLQNWGFHSALSRPG